MEKQHISAQRKQRATLNIETKLQILQRYFSEGVPEGAFVPRNMTEFRLWEDQALGVMKIGSPNTLEQTHNKGLRLRTQELILEITKQNHRKKKGSNEEKLRAEVREKDRLI